MKAPRLGLLLLGTIALASCGQQLSAPTAATPAQSSPVAAAPDTDSVAAQIAGYATRPELQDADSQAILKDHASDPLMLSALQEAYGQAAAPLDAAALAAQTSGQMPLSAVQRSRRPVLGAGRIQPPLFAQHGAEHAGRQGVAGFLPQ